MSCITHWGLSTCVLSRAGEITSRLSADTTTVSDEICLNLNVSLRSLTQAAIVLVFMFQASWRLTVVTFIMVPAIITMTKVYGDYYTCAYPCRLPLFGSGLSIGGCGRVCVSLFSAHL